ncbi:hypothetical protein E5Q_00961 [Mixia osmundae IAM 14324]|uniref:CFEM domain-containing protein n=1 Tax=Mixia osmundae (strain CBS 9802 / IAM 14324 / JCM 22182 / KY 12970) TaxID=764103 RepID=G7DUQ2_MIXOS|nr:hypothetical protein E5Q_00961 [Mixia osmundae IAM 14324]
MMQIYAALLTIVAALTVIKGQAISLGTEPTCVSQCYVTSAPYVTGCNSQDQSCLCQNDSFGSIMTDCFNKTCTSTQDQNSGMTYLQNLCKTANTTQAGLSTVTMTATTSIPTTVMQTSTLAGSAITQAPVPAVVTSVLERVHPSTLAAAAPSASPVAVSSNGWQSDARMEALGEAWPDAEAATPPLPADLLHRGLEASESTAPVELDCGSIKVLDTFHSRAGQASTPSSTGSSSKQVSPDVRPTARFDGVGSAYSSVIFKSQAPNVELERIAQALRVGQNETASDFASSGTSAPDLKRMFAPPSLPATAVATLELSLGKEPVGEEALNSLQETNNDSMVSMITVVPLVPDTPARDESGDVTQLATSQPADGPIAKPADDSLPLAAEDSLPLAAEEVAAKPSLRFPHLSAPAPHASAFSFESPMRGRIFTWRNMPHMSAAFTGKAVDLASSPSVRTTISAPELSPGSFSSSEESSELVTSMRQEENIRRNSHDVKHLESGTAAAAVAPPPAPVPMRTYVSMAASAAANMTTPGREQVPRHVERELSAALKPLALSAPPTPHAPLDSAPPSKVQLQMFGMNMDTITQTKLEGVLEVIDTSFFDSTDHPDDLESQGSEAGTDEQIVEETKWEESFVEDSVDYDDLEGEGDSRSLSIRNRSRKRVRLSPRSERGSSSPDESQSRSQSRSRSRRSLQARKSDVRDHGKAAKQLFAHLQAKHNDPMARSSSVSVSGDSVKGGTCGSASSYNWATGSSSVAASSQRHVSASSYSQLSATHEEPQEGSEGKSISATSDVQTTQLPVCTPVPTTVRNLARPGIQRVGATPLPERLQARISKRQSTPPDGADQSDSLSSPTSPMPSPSAAHERGQPPVLQVSAQSRVPGLTTIRPEEAGPHLAASQHGRMVYDSDRQRWINLVRMKQSIASSGLQQSLVERAEDDAEDSGTSEDEDVFGDTDSAPSPSAAYQETTGSEVAVAEAAPANDADDGASDVEESPLTLFKAIHSPVIAGQYAAPTSEPIAPVKESTPNSQRRPALKSRTNIPALSHMTPLEHRFAGTPRSVSWSDVKDDSRVHLNLSKDLTEVSAKAAELRRLAVVSGDAQEDALFSRAIERAGIAEISILPASINGFTVQTLRQPDPVLQSALLACESDKAKWSTSKTLVLRQRALASVGDLHEHMPALEQADVSRNKLESVLGLPNSARCLLVDHNLFRTTHSFAHLIHLERLDLSHNSLTSLEGLAQLPHLRELKADNNRLQSLDALFSLSGLARLSLRSNKLAEIRVPKRTWRHLEMLALSNNAITTVEGLDTCWRLSMLDLDHNKMKSFAPASAIPSMRVLRIAHNRLRSFDVAALPNLSKIYVDGNHLDEISNIHQLRRLSMLSICDQTDAVLTLTSSTIRDLTRLCLRGNAITNSLPSTPLYSLTMLDLSACQLVELPADFASVVPNCRSLNLAHNFIQDLSPLDGLARLQHLSIVGLRVNSCRGIVSALSTMPELESLDARLNPCTLAFYATTIEGSTRRDVETAWQTADARYRKTLPDIYYVKRMTYRAAILQTCPRMDRLDNLPVSATERTKLERLVSGVVGKQSAGNDETLAKELTTSAVDLGFLYLVGVPQDEEQVIRQMFALSRRFFSASLPDKQQYSMELTRNNLGYSCVGGEVLDKQTPDADFKEVFNIATSIDGQKQALPGSIQEELDTIKKFQSICFALCHRLLALLERGLGLEQGIFTDHHTIAGNPSVLRLLHYPPSSERSTELRDHWIDVPVLDHAILVNVADALEFWTNGTVKSTIHRVLVPQDSPGLDRYSIAWFHQPDDKAILKNVMQSSTSGLRKPSLAELSRMEAKGVAPGEVLTAKEHLWRRLGSTHGHLKAAATN